MPKWNKPGMTWVEEFFRDDPKSDPYAPVLLPWFNEGCQALISCAPGGGNHAASKKTKWQVVVGDAGFTNEAPLVASGNARAPFRVGLDVKIFTEVTNFAGSRTTSPGTIIIEKPIS